jgi:hypothetical protein
MADLHVLGRRLAAAGLTERAVLACFGASALAGVPRALACRPVLGRPAPAAVLPWLLVAGRDATLAAIQARLGDALDALIAAGLLDIDGDHVRAARALVPIGPSLAVCDRLDTPTNHPDAVLWPDDSSHHLIGALPRGRIGRWLDVGTGSALAPLAARGRAVHVRATDLNPRAVDAAALGAGLSGAGIDTTRADLGDGAGGGWDLVTFNAPIPAEASTEAGDTAIHRRAPPGAAVLERFWRQAPALIADGGEVVVHSFLDDDALAITADLPGAVGVIRYTPPGHAGFGVTSWRPGGSRRRRVIEVALSGVRPHVRRDDVDAALEVGPPDP